MSLIIPPFISYILILFVLLLLLLLFVLMCLFRLPFISLRRWVLCLFSFSRPLNSLYSCFIGKTESADTRSLFTHTFIYFFRYFMFFLFFLIDWLIDCWFGLLRFWGKWIRATVSGFYRNYYYTCEVYSRVGGNPKRNGLESIICFFLFN